VMVSVAGPACATSVMMGFAASAAAMLAVLDLGAREHGKAALDVVISASLLVWALN
jgi:hypothetical protein